MGVGDRLVSNTPPYINARALATVAMGIIATAIGEGLAQTIGTTFDAFLITPLQGARGFVETVYGDVAQIGPRFLQDLIRVAAEWVTQFGAFAWPAAVVLVLIGAYAINKAGELRA